VLGGWAESQLWLFWVAPILGAALAGVVYRWVGGEEPPLPQVTGNP
jgi:aquaporin Z